MQNLIYIWYEPTIFNLTLHCLYYFVTSSLISWIYKKAEALSFKYTKMQTDYSILH